MNGRRVCFAVVGTLALLGALAPTAASGASVGDITRAVVNSDWAAASIAGEAVRANGCLSPPPSLPEPKSPEAPKGPTVIPKPDSPPWACGWIPFATAGPGASPGDCTSPSRRWGSLGGEVQLLWAGPELASAGSVPFDLESVALAQGAATPLICLAAVEAVSEAVACAAVEGVSCPPYAIVHRIHQLDSALLEVASPSPPGLGPSPKPCRRLKQRAKSPRGKSRIGLGQGVAVTGQGQRVRRCKRG